MNPHAISYNRSHLSQSFFSWNSLFVKALIDAGATDTVVDQQGNLAAHIAAYGGDYHSLALLVNHQRMNNPQNFERYITTKNHEGHTLLKAAIASGCDLTRRVILDSAKTAGLQSFAEHILL